MLDLLNEWTALMVDMAQRVAPWLSNVLTEPGFVVIVMYLWIVTCLTSGAIGAAVAIGVQSIGSGGRGRTRKGSSETIERGY